LTFIIIGASAGLGRDLAEKFASEKNDLIIISSDMRDLIPLKLDLEIKFRVKIISIEISFKKIPIDFSLITEALDILSPLEGILFPIGYAEDNDTPGTKEYRAVEIVTTNLISVCLITNYFLDRLKERRSLIIGFGSVAAIRGRTQNSTYAASKRGLESFFESLRHYTQNFNIITQFYILGYLDTNLLVGDDKTTIFKRVDTKKLSKIVYNNRFKNFGKTVYPKKWAIIRLLLPIIPWKIFKEFKK
jgi:short-subunit dehydrogenase